MKLLACGINYRSAPVALREQFAVAPEKQKLFLKQLVNTGLCTEAVFLATCNRCELYAVTASQEALVDYLIKAHNLPANEFLTHFYLHQDAQAIRHVIQVASGMDSMVFGEPQVFGQLKEAVALAKDSGVLGSSLSFIFQQIFAATKQIRATTPIGQETTSIASVAVNLAKLIYEDFSKLTVLLIGAGDTISQVLQQLSHLKVKEIYAANRDVQKASFLLEKHQGQAIPLAHIETVLPQCDIVISATASDNYIITHEMLNKILKKKNRPTYLIDLAVPRDIEPSIGQLDGFYLYNIDDLQKIINTNLTKRKTAISHADNIINNTLKACKQKIKLKQHHQLIQQYREESHIVKMQELNKALIMLEKGHAPETIINLLAHNLTQKLTHIPTLYIKDILFTSEEK